MLKNVMITDLAQYFFIDIIRSIINKED